MKLKHVDVVAGTVFQYAREVKTKFSKTFTTMFFPVGDDVRQIVVGWVAFLRNILLWGEDDPLFPATAIIVGASQQFEAAGLARKHWSSAAPTNDDSREKKQVGNQWETSSGGGCLFLFAVAQDEDGRSVSRQIADKIG